MVYGAIARGIGQIIRHRKAIYAVITAQDRYISKSLKYSGWGKSASFGWRSGAAAGGLIGPLINDQVTELTNGSIQPITPSRDQYKKRTRNIRYNRSRYKYNDSYSRNNRRFCKPRRTKFSRTR